jgi:hypothetical protein
MVVLPVVLAWLLALQLSGTKGHDPKTVMQECRMILGAVLPSVVEVS